MRGGATAGPVGDLRKRFSPLWLSSVDNRSSLQADPFRIGLARSIIRIYGRGYGGGDATCLNGRRHRGFVLKRFPAKWRPVRVKKTRQTKNLEPRSDAIGTEKALVNSGGALGRNRLGAGLAGGRCGS